MKNKKRFILIFSAIYYYIVIMLACLQVSTIPWFFLWLVLMHAGIVGLIILKKQYRGSGINYKMTYKIAYGSLLLFVPILIYKLITRILGVEEHVALIETAVLILIIITILTGLFNILYYNKQH